MIFFHQGIKVLSQHFIIRNFKIADKLFKHETKTYIYIIHF